MNQYYYGNAQDEKGYPDEGYALSRLTQLNATNKGKIKANWNND